MINLDAMIKSVKRLERVFGSETRATQSIGEVADLLTRLRQAEKDAVRYRWLRACRWNESNLCVVTEPKVSVKLGTDCPSFERLDAAIDEAMKCK